MFGCCGGENRRGRLSETIKAAGMRESRKEGMECGKVIKTRMRGE
jgi:hypothetical protein